MYKRTDENGQRVRLLIAFQRKRELEKNRDGGARNIVTKTSERGATFTTHLTIVASLDLSNKCAASTAETMAPSSADKSHVSSETRNFLARLKNAAGPFDALTAMTCLGVGVVSSVDGYVLSDG